MVSIHIYFDCKFTALVFLSSLSNFRMRSIVGLSLFSFSGGVSLLRVDLVQLAKVERLNDWSGFREHLWMQFPHSLQRCRRCKGSVTFGVTCVAPHSACRTPLIFNHSSSSIPASSSQVSPTVLLPVFSASSWMLLAWSLPLRSDCRIWLPSSSVAMGTQYAGFFIFRWVDQ